MKGGIIMAMMKTKMKSKNILKVLFLLTLVFVFMMCGMFLTGCGCREGDFNSTETQQNQEYVPTPPTPGMRF